jgi:hypothetical protein
LALGIGKTVLPVLFIAATILGGCATVPEPAHKIVSRNNGYEVREYAGYLVAETTVSGPWTIPPFRRNEIIVLIR